MAEPGRDKYAYLSITYQSIYLSSVYHWICLSIGLVTHLPNNLSININDQKINVALVRIIVIDDGTKVCLYDHANINDGDNYHANQKDTRVTRLGTPVACDWSFVVMLLVRRWLKPEI